MPYGTKRDEIANSISTSWQNSYRLYHSPGLHCPAGWETVGVAAGSGRPTSGAGLHATPTNASGLFTLDPWPYESGDLMADLPVVKQWVGMIKDSEIIVVCCPKYVACFLHCH